LAAVFLVGASDLF